MNINDKEFKFEMSYKDLFKRAVINAKPKTCGSAPKWVAVMDTFSLGSYYAIELCRALDLDPYAKSLNTVKCITCNP